MNQRALLERFAWIHKLKVHGIDVRGLRWRRWLDLGHGLWLFFFFCRDRLFWLSNCLWLVLVLRFWLYLRLYLGLYLRGRSGRKLGWWWA